MTRPLECPDHWHCDPEIAAHVCDAPDRARPCPTCGETRRVMRRVETFTATEGDRSVTVISESEFATRVRFPHGDRPTRPVHPDDWKTCHLFNPRTGAIDTYWRGELVAEDPILPPREGQVFDPALVESCILREGQHPPPGSVELLPNFPGVYVSPPRDPDEDG